jgi:cell division protein FtsZ
MNITSTSDLTMEEMTEASDRIYNEVGEEADIIWGTVVDDSLGDEMRVTVIATGIGQGKAAEEPQKQVDETFGGKLRSVTAEDLEKVVDYEEPAFMRRRRAAAGGTGGGFGAALDHFGHGRDTVDETDLDIPTFLRRKAD